MAQQRIDDGLVSVEEYLEMEERSEVRHEYVGGMLHAMTGGSHRHNRITVNIARKLDDAASGGPCDVYIADMRFQIGNVYYYLLPGRHGRLRASGNGEPQLANQPVPRG